MPGLCRKRVDITNDLGLHLRAANRLVQVAQRFSSQVRVWCNGRAADGKSIIDLMGLGAAHGSSLELEVQGIDAEEAGAALQELIESCLRESDDEDDGPDQSSAGPPPAKEG